MTERTIRHRILFWRRTTLALIALATLLFALSVVTHFLASDTDSWSDPWAGLRWATAVAALVSLAASVLCYRQEHRIAHDTPADFLAEDEEDRVVQAIRRFEEHTSGEIRVHLEHRVRRSPEREAQRIFRRLDMDRTAQRNGVLFFVAVHDHKFVVIGDLGIDRVVGDDFWDEVASHVEEEFRKGRYMEGLIDGIERAGRALTEHFPPRPDDENELPDTISR